MTLRVRLLAMLLGVVLAGGGALVASRITDGGDASARIRELSDAARTNPFSPVVSGQPDLPREIPGYASCDRAGRGCAFVEMTLARYARIVGDDPALYVHDDPDVRPCPRPEGPEEGEGQPPCRELPKNVTVVLSLEASAAEAFVERFGCGEPVVDPCR